MSDPATATGDVKAGIRLSFFGTVLTGVLQFAAMMVLARLLEPAEYGIYALCLAIVSLSTVFVTNVAERFLVVAAPDSEELDQSAVIAVLCIAVSALAFTLCATINQFIIAPIELGELALIALSACLASAAVMPRVILRRRLHFGPIIATELAAMVVGQGLVSIALAAAGWGFYALAVGACVQSAVTVLMLRFRVRSVGLVAPTLRNCLKLARRALALGGNAAAEIVNGQISPLMIGATLGPIALGLFNRSYSLVQMPIQLLVASLNRVMVSALFSVSGDRERFHTAARLLAIIAGVVATPVAAGIAGASRNFVIFAFGPEWIEAANIMPLVAIAAWATMMGSLLAVVAEAMRAFTDKTRVQLASSLTLAVLALLGAEAGLAGALGGIAFSCCGFMLLYARLTARLLDVPLRLVLSWFLPGIAIALPCFAASLTIGLLWGGHPKLVFAAQVGSCGAIEVAMLLVFYPSLALRIAQAASPAILGRLPRLQEYLQKAGRDLTN